MSTATLSSGPPAPQVSSSETLHPARSEAQPEIVVGSIDHEPPASLAQRRTRAAHRPAKPSPPSDIDTAGADSNLPPPSSSFSPGAPLVQDRLYMPGQPKSLSGIALRSFCLGAALAVGLHQVYGALVFFGSDTPLWRVPFFLVALSAFHFLEFWTTAAYNTSSAGVGSFLLTANWPAYPIAHATAVAECCIVSFFFPDRSWAPFNSGNLLVLFGFACVLVGQAVRSVAMAKAGSNFNHTVQQQHRSGHVLVSTGIYAVLRHPSYFGFFWWALGTQLVMGNVVCFFAYAAALWRFFSSRIKTEERLLIEFFGNDYVEYRKRVGTKIPFIP